MNDSKRKWPARLASLLVVAALTAGLLGGCWEAQRDALNNSGSRFEDASFTYGVYPYSIVLSWRLAQQNAGQDLVPCQAFFPTLAEAYGWQPRELYGDDDGDASTAPPDAASSVAATPTVSSEITPAQTGEATDITGEQADAIQWFLYNFNMQVYSWSDEYENGWEGVEALAVDATTGAAYGRQSAQLLAMASGDFDFDSHQFAALLCFSRDGILIPQTVYGASQDNLSQYLQSIAPANGLVYSITDDESIAPLLLSRLVMPQKNVDIVLAVPFTAGASPHQIYYEETIFHRSGGPAFYTLLFAALAALLGLLLAALRPLGLNRLSPARMPLEVSAGILLLGLLLAAEQVQAILMVYTFNGALLPALLPISMDPELAALGGWVLLAGLVAAALALIYFAAASLWQLRLLGLKRYLMEKCLVVMALLWVLRLLKRLWGWLTAIDLTDKSNRDILKLLGINFLIVAVMCCAWFFGLILLVGYTVLLFVLLRRYFTKLKAQHATLLQATGQMAQGKLDVEIDEDLGVFEPLKQELMTVRQGFDQAVQAETRSQAMKTELITNVSHDLKTPLTAIITYVGLLKKEDLTEEERASYVATLDQKSQRLKRLIEDLFEVSKASSRDIVLNTAPVDLAALLRQVVSENSTELEDAGVDFRLRLPEAGATLTLDGEKTSRIFENLVLNVAKYAMPGTRAWATLTSDEASVSIEIKNVSRQELSFDSDAITDRFVRGDAARSTEGSGLGLAIAKSFTEAQGGSFAVTADDDIFKATVSFPAG